MGKSNCRRNTLEAKAQVSLTGQFGARTNPLGGLGHRRWKVAMEPVCWAKRVSKTPRWHLPVLLGDPSHRQRCQLRGEGARGPGQP